MKCLFAFLLLLASLVPAQSIAEEIGVEARTIETLHPWRTRSQFGALEFKGGLVLQAPRPFGAFSGMRIDEDRLLAVSDTGFLLSARLARQDGRLARLFEARLVPILSETGRPYRYKWDSDAEALEWVPGRGAIVAFERNNRILLYPGDPFRSKVAGRVVAGAVPQRMRQNRGLEALALAPRTSPLAGRLLAFTEGVRDENGDPVGFVIDMDGRQPSAGFAVADRKDGFAVTDATFATDGTLFLLERRYSLGRGPGMRIRRVEASDVRVGARLDGDTLIEVGLPHAIDNMEGLSVVERNGRTRLLVISDDNYSALQRTLLLEFELR